MPTVEVLIAVTTLPLAHVSVKGSPPEPPSADPPGAATAVGVVMYCPTGQPEHADDPAVAVEPKVHGWQAVETVRPDKAEKVPTTQFEQLSTPAAVEYCPAGQSVQMIPDEAVYWPAKQLLQADAAVVEKLPVGGYLNMGKQIHH